MWHKTNRMGGQSDMMRWNGGGWWLIDFSELKQFHCRYFDRSIVSQTDNESRMKMLVKTYFAVEPTLQAWHVIEFSQNFQYFHCRAQTTGNLRYIKMIPVKLWFHIYSSLVKSDATNSLVDKTTIHWNDGTSSSNRRPPNVAPVVAVFICSDSLAQFKPESNTQFMFQCNNNWEKLPFPCYWSSISFIIKSEQLIFSFSL